jgi:hypothetical protein
MKDARPASVRRDAALLLAIRLPAEIHSHYGGPRNGRFRGQHRRGIPIRTNSFIEVQYLPYLPSSQRSTGVADRSRFVRAWPRAYGGC